MSPRSKREYAKAIYDRYKRASRREKATILDEFCTTVGGLPYVPKMGNGRAQGFNFFHS